MLKRLISCFTNKETGMTYEKMLNIISYQENAS